MEFKAGYVFMSLAIFLNVSNKSKTKRPSFSWITKIWDKTMTNSKNLTL